MSGAGDGRWKFGNHSAIAVVFVLAGDPKDAAGFKRGYGSKLLTRGAKFLGGTKRTKDRVGEIERHKAMLASMQARLAEKEEEVQALRAENATLRRQLVQCEARLVGDV